MKGTLPPTLELCYHFFLNEVNITRRLLASNASFVIGIYLIGLAPRMMTAQYIASPIVLIAKVLFTAFAHAYAFDICNQTLSPEEDARNKPSRPIPAGLLSVKGGYIRWILWWIFSPIAFVAMGVPTAAFHLVASLAWTFFCYAWPRPLHWFWKSLYTPVAIFFLLRLLNSLLVLHIPDSEMAVHLDGVFCLWLFATIHMQDFHDVKGDRAAGRKTLPIVLSVNQLGYLRRSTAALTVAAAMLIAALGVKACDGSFDFWIVLLASLQFLGGCVTAGRFLRNETAAQAERTYKRCYVPTMLAVMSYLSVVNNAGSFRETA
jgi:4-hydroxybenzoate polyprenyltransferase